MSTVTCTCVLLLMVAKNPQRLQNVATQCHTGWRSRKHDVTHRNPRHTREYDITFVFQLYYANKVVAWYCTKSPHHIVIWQFDIKHQQHQVECPLRHSLYIILES